MMQSVLELSMSEFLKDLRPGNVAEVPHQVKPPPFKEQISYAMTSPDFSCLVLRYLQLRDRE